MFLYFRIIPHIPRCTTSIKKIKLEVKQRHEEQIEKEQEANWRKYVENIENVNTDICMHYDTEIEKGQEINAELKLKEVNDRYLSNVYLSLFN